MSNSFYEGVNTRTCPKVRSLKSMIKRFIQIFYLLNQGSEDTWEFKALFISGLFQGYFHRSFK